MASDKHKTSQSGLGGLGGVAIGMILTILYVKFGFTLPGWLQPVETVKDSFISLSASLAVDENNLAELQREIAVKMKQPSYYTSLDNSLDNFITEEVVWRTRTKRTLKLLQDQIKAVDARSGQFAPTLSGALDRLPKRLIKEKELAHKYLQRRFPDRTDSEIIAELIRLPLTEVLQMRYPSARILFALPSESHTKIVVSDATEQPVKTLMDGDLPMGQYRLYWDFTDEGGERLPADVAYTYEISLNGERHRVATLELPPAVWE